MSGESPAFRRGARDLGEVDSHDIARGWSSWP